MRFAFGASNVSGSVKENWCRKCCLLSVNCCFIATDEELISRSADLNTRLRGAREHVHISPECYMWERYFLSADLPCAFSARNLSTDASPSYFFLPVTGRFIAINRAFDDPILSRVY